MLLRREESVIGLRLVLSLCWSTTGELLFIRRLLPSPLRDRCWQTLVQPYLSSIWKWVPTQKLDPAFTSHCQGFPVKNIPKLRSHKVSLQQFSKPAWIITISSQPQGIFTDISKFGSVSSNRQAICFHNKQYHKSQGKQHSCQNIFSPFKKRNRPCYNQRILFSFWWSGILHSLTGFLSLIASNRLLALRMGLHKGTL